MKLSDMISMWPSILICVVILLAVIGWHFTPREQMYLWGPAGCASVENDGKPVVEGCGPYVRQADACECCVQCPMGRKKK